MMKMINKKKSKLAAKILLCASLCGSLFPVQAKADMAEDIINALTAAGADAQTIAAVSLQQIRGEVDTVLAAAGEWNEAAFRDVLRIAEQAGVTIDALIPTIQGCIKEEDGTPLLNATVIEVGVIPGGIGTLVPIIAATSGEGLPATVFGIPVDESWLSEKQKQNWGPGCYWLPVVPGLADGIVSIIQQESLILHRIIPVMQGYKMNPPAKIVKLFPGEEEATIESLDTVFHTYGQTNTTAPVN